MDLIELDNVATNGIFKCLTSHSGALGLTEEFFKDYLVSLTCDRAAVMLDTHGIVAALLKKIILTK